nr:hypothetical protein [Tanacetum cinerariifolium]
MTRLRLYTKFLKKLCIQSVEMASCVSSDGIGMYEVTMSEIWFLALGWHLEEIHLTWTHLKKKTTRLRLYTKFLKKLCIQSVEMASRVSSDGIGIYEVTMSEIW